MLNVYQEKGCTNFFMQNYLSSKEIPVLLRGRSLTKYFDKIWPITEHLNPRLKLAKKLLLHTVISYHLHSTYLVLSRYLKNDPLRKFSQIKDESNNLSVTSITNFKFYVNPVAFCQQNSGGNSKLNSDVVCSTDKSLAEKVEK